MKSADKARLDAIVKAAGNGAAELKPLPQVQLVPIVTTLAGCQIMITEERHELTGESIRTLSAIHPSGHQYDVKMPLAAAQNIGKALASPANAKPEDPS